MTKLRTAERRHYRRTSHAGRRSGTVLVLVGISLFAILAVLGLVFDFGHVVVERRRLQTATNTSALDNLREGQSGDVNQSATVARWTLASVNPMPTTIRAQSVAEARPAMTVGAAVSGRPGLFPAAVSFAAWQASNAFTADRAIDATRAWTVGDSIAAAPEQQPITTAEYIAIYANINGAERVVGFGRVASNGNGGYTKQSTANVADNASAHWRPPQLSSEDIAALLVQHHQLTNLLMAPALVRSVQ